jgi:Holliday junction resolvase RusA-like endonuclease
VSFRICLEIPTIAVAKARPRFTKKGFAFTPQKTSSFEAEVRWAWKAHGHPMIPKVPTALEIVCELPRPKSLKKSIKIPITKPDVDNYAKAICDALNGFAWEDDNQITDLTIRKRFALGAPQIKISIMPTMGEDNAA